MTTTQKEVEHTKCACCKCHRPLSHFLNKSGRKLKSCHYCRNFQQRARLKARKLPTLEDIMKTLRKVYPIIDFTPQDPPGEVYQIKFKLSRNI